MNPIDPLAWEDHGLLRRLVCDIALEWAPGTRVHYHRRSAHWVAAVLIEALGGMDFRAFLRKRLLEPVGLQREIYVGLPRRSERARRLARRWLRTAARMRSTRGEPPEYQAAGIPGTGAIATALGMAAYYQMMLGGGRAERRADPVAAA